MRGYGYRLIGVFAVQGFVFLGSVEVVLQLVFLQLLFRNLPKNNVSEERP